MGDQVGEQNCVWPQTGFSNASYHNVNSLRIIIVVVVRPVNNIVGRLNEVCHGK